MKVHRLVDDRLRLTQDARVVIEQELWLEEELVRELEINTRFPHTAAETVEAWFPDILN